MTKHEALIAGTRLLSAIDSRLDFRTLTIEADLNFTSSWINISGFVAVAYLAQDSANQLRCSCLNRGKVFRSGGPELPSHDDFVVCSEGLASDSGIGIEPQEGIENGVRNLIAELIRMPGRYGFRGEQPFKNRHKSLQF
ncbi:hypothetical protein K426_04540 [Sphingobium sp. TKS]|nr:hypothetical protein K426_04540 [Sphingobium sp. TKS]